MSAPEPLPPAITIPHTIRSVSLPEAKLLKLVLPSPPYTPVRVSVFSSSLPCWRAASLIEKHPQPVKPRPVLPPHICTPAHAHIHTGLGPSLSSFPPGHPFPFSRLRLRSEGSHLLQSDYQLLDMGLAGKEGDSHTCAEDTPATLALSARCSFPAR